MSLEDHIRDLLDDALDARKKELAQEAFVKKGTYGDVGDALRTKKGMAGLVKKPHEVLAKIKDHDEKKERQGEQKQKELEESVMIPIGKSVLYNKTKPNSNSVTRRIPATVVGHEDYKSPLTGKVTHQVHRIKFEDGTEKTLHGKHLTYKEDVELSEDGGGMSCTSGMDMNSSGFPAPAKRKKKLRQKTTIFKRKII